MSPQSASVSFTPPANNGGSAITGYTATSTPGGITATGTTSPIIISGLTNGTPYTFTVHATNANGNSVESAASNSVTPLDVPVASFLTSASSGEIPFSVTFTDTSTNNPTSWLWIFGDGTTSTLQNPSHTFNLTADYSVTLEATNSGGTNNVTHTISATTNLPVASFTATPTSGTVPLAVTFTDTSLRATAWEWDFGDGTSSTSQNPTHVFTGVYVATVALTATNAFGTSTTSHTVTVTEQTPVADFIGTPTTGLAPLAVTFSDLSTNLPTSWLWNFGDGATATVQNPTHVYSAAGSYTVELTATNAAGANSKTSTSYVTASALTLGYQAPASLRLRKSANAYLTRTFNPGGSRTTWTISTWAKRGVLGAIQQICGYYQGNAANQFSYGFNADDTLSIVDYVGSYQLQFTTHRTFRDPSAWYHMVLAVDTQQITPSDRVKLYVNGVQETSFAIANYPAQVTLTRWNLAEVMNIGYKGTGQDYSDITLSEFRFIDNQALTPDYFGQYNAEINSWVPIQYAGIQDSRGQVMSAMNFDAPLSTATELSGTYGAGYAQAIIGSTAVRDTSITKFGTASASFSGRATDMIYTTGNQYTNLGSGDFTVQLWAYPTSNAGLQRLFSIDTSGYALVTRIQSGVYMSYFRFDGNSTVYTLSTSTATILNTWQHLALVRHSNVFTLYLNGVSIGSMTNSGGLDLTGLPITLSALADYYYGNLDDFLFVKTALWTANFTPPTSGLTYSPVYTTTPYYGTNGCYLPFTDNAAVQNLGHDFSGSSSGGLVYRGETLPPVSTPQDADPYYADVSLLIQGTGDNGSTTVIDTSVSPNTIAVFGAAAISTAQAKFGASSLHVDGTTGAYVQTAAPNFSDGADFTIEWWALPETISAVFCGSHSSNSGWIIQVGKDWQGVSGRYIVQWGQWGVSSLFEYCYSAVDGCSGFAHFAVASYNNVVTCYINGVAGAPLTYGSPASYSGQPLQIGQEPGGSGPNGAFYVNSFRITRGVARYRDASITDPYHANVALLIEGNGYAVVSTKVVDTSPLPNVITNYGVGYATTASEAGGSALHFDGSSYLTVPYRPSFDFGAADFTIETWAYLNSLPPNGYAQILIGRDNAGTANRSWVAYITNTGGTYDVRLDGSVDGTAGFPVIVAPIALAASQWFHVAIVKASNVTTVFFNGTVAGTVADTNTYASSPSSGIFIGANEVFSAPANYLNGYMQGIRVTNYARYTAAFTPPKANILGTVPSSVPLLAAPDCNAVSPMMETTLLVHGVGANGSTIILDSSEPGNTVTAFGAAAISTAQAKFGTSAIYFDGSTSYLSIPAAPGLNLVGVDFTIELQVYPLTFNSPYMQVLDKDGVAGSSYSEYNIGIGADGTVGMLFGSGNGVSSVASYSSTASITLNAWNHIAVSVAGSTAYLFLNGTLAASGAVPTMIDGGKPLIIGHEPGQPAITTFHGYMADIRITRGYARYTAGNGNNWSPINVQLNANTPSYDSMYDVPYGQSGSLGNYAVFDLLSSVPAAYYVAGYSPALITDGGLTASSTGLFYAAANFCGLTTWYCEVTPVTIGPDLYVSVADVNGGGVCYISTGSKFVGTTPSTFVASGYGAAFAANDVIGIAADSLTNTVTFYKNGVSQGTLTHDFGGKAPIFNLTTIASGTTAVSANFGQRPFSQAIPALHLAMHTGNLAMPPVLAPNLFMEASTYIGNASALTIVNQGGFQPDLVWIKSRNAVGSHKLVDSTRGATHALSADTTAPDVVETDGLTSFNANGFTLGANASYNALNSSYVAWQWKKGVTPGFDIVEFQGDGGNSHTITHGLGVPPSLIVGKCAGPTGGRNGLVWHEAFAPSDYISLNLTNAKNYPGVVGTTFGGSTAIPPTSATFTLGNEVSLNAPGSTNIAYLFAAVPGFSAFGSYVGDGTTNGPFINCGFRPKFVLVKNTSVAEDWFMLDSVRDGMNPEQSWLEADNNHTESTGILFGEFTALGFKVRSGTSGGNISGSSYIYAAFAENPFKYALAR